MDILDIRRPEAWMCSSRASVEELVAASGSLSKGESFACCWYGQSRSLTALPPFVNAHLRYAEKSMRADSLQKGTLLFIAGTMDIRNAIKASGIRSNSRFVVFASGEAAFSSFVKKSGSEVIKKYGLVLDPAVASEVAAAGIRQES